MKTKTVLLILDQAYESYPDEKPPFEDLPIWLKKTSDTGTLYKFIFSLSLSSAYMGYNPSIQDLPFSTGESEAICNGKIAEIWVMGDFVTDSQKRIMVEKILSDFLVGDVDGNKKKLIKGLGFLGSTFVDNFF